MFICVCHPLTEMSLSTRNLWRKSFAQEIRVKISAPQYALQGSNYTFCLNTFVKCTIKVAQLLLLYEQKLLGKNFALCVKACRNGSRIPWFFPAYFGNEHKEERNIYHTFADSCLQWYIWTFLHFIASYLINPIQTEVNSVKTLLSLRSFAQTAKEIFRSFAKISFISHYRFLTY